MTQPRTSKPGVKPGYRTTEGIATGVVVIYAIADSLAGTLPDKYGAIAAAVSAGLYSIGRGVAKWNGGSP